MACEYLRLHSSGTRHPDFIGSPMLSSACKQDHRMTYATVAILGATFGLCVALWAPLSFTTRQWSPAIAASISPTRFPTLQGPSMQPMRLEVKALPAIKPVLVRQAILPVADKVKFAPARIAEDPQPLESLSSGAVIGGMIGLFSVLTLKLSSFARPSATVAMFNMTSEAEAGRSSDDSSPPMRNETPVEATNRRLSESQEVTDKVIPIHSLSELQSQLRAQPDPKHVFIAEILDPRRCDSGLAEEPEIQWRRSETEIMAPVYQFKHTFQRTARNCPDVTFFEITWDGSVEVATLLSRLEVSLAPTVLFIKDGRVVWRHDGAEGVTEDLNDGIQWFADTSSDGERPSAVVPDLHSLAELEAFRKPTDSTDLLRVVLVLTGCSASCIRLYPVMPAVGKHMSGRASFARLVSDNKETKDVLRHLTVEYVPLMLIFDAKTGEELGRHVVTSRGDFMGLFLRSLEEMEAKEKEQAASLID